MQDFEFRLRLLEERYSKFRDRLMLINQNMIDEFKSFNEMVEKSLTEVKTMRKDLDELKEVTQNLVKVSKDFAEKKDILVLEKYIKMWDPVKFITEKDVKRIMEKEGLKNRRRRRS